jgi:6,7-dimethyl-8-ribityllumazine synthase
MKPVTDQQATIDKAAVAEKQRAALKSLSGVQSQIGIVVSTYNSSITSNLQSGAIATLKAAGVNDSAIMVSHVPGAWELPLAAKWLAELSSVACIITLGAVIRGETSHDLHINRAVSNALMELMQTSGKPIAFGLLTCNTLDQAIARSGGDVGNKGDEAAQAVLEMLALRQSLRSL